MVQMKEKYGKVIIKMKFVVFFVWLMTNGNPQIMSCLFCYKSPVNVFKLSTIERNRLITHYKSYGITSLKKHVDANLVVIVKKNEEEVNGPIRGNFKRQLV